MVANLNIVVIEDNNDLRTLLCNGLSSDGHHVTGLSSAEELEDQAGIDHADAFLVDINLPGENGLILSKRIRRAHPLVGIIILSARLSQDDKLDGYDSGADMYLTKPVEMTELRAAFRSFARRRQATMQHVTPHALTLNKLDLKGRAGSVKLSIQEAIILTAMARAPAGKLETWQIAELLGVEVDDSFKSSLAVRMVRLRKKLNDAGAEGIAIEAIRQFGYQLVTQVEIY
ncbi:MAG: DNA-binding response regulator [Betaproteobacteria bacterium]|nr:DNA-binding response regulator [Betaproteobacteria bacterium]